MSLVLMCGENDLTQFGTANLELFSEMLVDLKDLEESVITVDGEWSEELCIVLLVIIWVHMALVGLHITSSSSVLLQVL